MTSPSQTPEAAGLEVVDLNGLLHQAWQRLHRSEADVPGALVVLNALHVALETPLVTAASAQAAIDVEKARADRLAKALEPFATAAGKLDGLWDENDWRWNDSVLSNVTVRDLRSARAALQQETQP